ncbi:MAG: ABC transporter ATP-binding protein [Acidimicrobiia bacterium]
MLNVSGVSVRYGDALALDRVDLAVHRGEIVAVLGPSGSGKTSLLRAIGGLEPVTTGEIVWDDDPVTHLPAHRRGFGLMFQDHALFSHHDVIGNVEFGLRMKADRSPSDRRSRARAVLDLVGLAGYDHRRVDQLSGGEQQRVALARALAPSPRLLMLDEPLASVDRERREHLAAELHRIIRAAGTPTLLVTHDLDEAFTLADVVVVLDGGHVLQCGPAPEVWRAPNSIVVARFLGVTTELRLPVDRDSAITPWGRVVAPSGAKNVWIGLRPGDLRVDPDGQVSGTVRTVWFRRDHYLLELDTADGPMTVTSSRPVAVGDHVHVRADLEAAVILDA